MELDDIKRYALASREFEAQAAGGRVTARLRVPTRHEVQLAVRRAQAKADGTQTIVIERQLLEQALVAWAGVLLTDVLPGHQDAAEPLAYEPGAVPLLLDAQPDWAEEWGKRLFSEMKARRDIQDAAEKN